jgi:hypothetical protein
MVCFMAMYWLPEYQYRQKNVLRHERFNQFSSAIKPILKADKKFENVFLGEYTGGGHGALDGFVVSTNDLEQLHEIYSNTLSSHPAVVGFHVKVVEVDSH